MPKEYNLMSRDELESELKRLRADLEDLEETVAFHLANTAAHISGSSVTQAEEEQEELKTEIATVEKMLSEM